MTGLNCLQHNKIEAKDVLECEYGYLGDRDINVAFNILIKNC